LVDGDLPSLAVDEAVGAEHLLDDAVGPTVGRVGPVDTPSERGVIAGVVDNDGASSDRGAEFGEEQGSVALDEIAEELDIKTALFENLDEICRPGAILATTTSSLPVVDLASVTSRPGDVVGLHFFNPAPVMKLVEIVDTVATSPDVVATARSVVSRIGKVGVHCGDRAGFIVNALLFPYLNDAIKMAEGNYATTDDIDTAMKVGCGYPMGPFELLDVVDTVRTKFSDEHVNLMQCICL